MLKRLLDIVLSIIGVIIITPLIPIIGLLIKLDSKGPVFYSCDRIGKDGKPFRMHKFRTMIDTSVYVGDSLAPQGDVRVTSFGRFLRQAKLNELPQLFNVLKGEMSFVGPRPEAPDLAELYPEEARVLFTIRPGLVGPAQIMNRNEDELYPEGADIKEYYIQNILPDKLKIDLQYVRKPTILNDLKYILLTVKETITGAITKRHFFENKDQIYLFLFDMVFVIGCYLFAIKLRFEGGIPAEELPILIKTFPILFFYRIVCFIGFGLYSVLIRYLSLSSCVDVIKAVTVSTLLSAVTAYAMGFYFPRSIWIIDWFCVNAFMIFIRVPGKLVRDKIQGKEDNGKKRIFIFGAGDKGKLAALQLADKVMILGFLDDDHSKKNKRFQEYSVLGNRYDIEPLSKIHKIDEVVISISDLEERSLNHLISLCHKAHVEYSVFTTPVDTYADRLREEYIRNKKIFQWIGGQELNVDLSKIKSNFSDKRIMVIGPSNILGLELLKYLSPLHPREIILLDSYESYLNETIQRALTFMPKDKIKPILSSDPLPVAAKRILSSATPPSIVIHMGTRKYSSPFTLDPLKTARENILNTWDILQMAGKAECELFVMISSFGADNPVNFTQATLRLAEHYLQSKVANFKTRTAVVRLYNLVENRGSILRTIQNQLKYGRKIFLNHPEEQRYFMTASSAAKLILSAAAMRFEGGFETGEVFIPVFNGYKPVKILDMARLIIQDYGLDPDTDVEIDFNNSDNSMEWKDEFRLDGKLVVETPHKKIKKILQSFHFSELQAEGDIRNFKELIERKDRKSVEEKVEQVLRMIQNGENEKPENIKYDSSNNHVVGLT